MVVFFLTKVNSKSYYPVAARFAGSGNDLLWCACPATESRSAGGQIIIHPCFITAPLSTRPGLPCFSSFQGAFSLRCTELKVPCTIHDIGRINEWLYCQKIHRRER